MSRLSKSIESKIKQTSGCLRLGLEEKWEVNANGLRVSFGDDGNILKLTVVMVAQLGRYAKNCRILYFKWASCMVCASHLNKAVVLFF